MIAHIFHDSILLIDLFTSFLIDLFTSFGKDNNLFIQIFSLLHAANFTYLEIRFWFQRYIATFAMVYWYTAVLTVYVTYCAAYIPVFSGPGRFLICVVMIGVQFTIYGDFRNQIPQTSYTTVKIHYLIYVLEIHWNLCDRQQIFGAWYVLDLISVVLRNLLGLSTSNIGDNSELTKLVQ